jgi:hypothetical protein
VISTFLVEHALLVRVGFWLAVVVALVAGWLLYRTRAQTTLVVLAGFGFVGALALTFLPEDERSGGVSCTIQFSVPFQGLDTLANVAMLLPLALFLGLATRRPMFVLGGVSGMAVMIELVQALAPAMGRVCDTNDWFMNTTGALIGALSALGILVLDSRRNLIGSTIATRAS